MNRIISFLLMFASTTFAGMAQTGWQQELNYIIHVSLNDSLHRLNGNIEIEYINNSPDNLDKIYMHLWPNAYENNSTAFAKQKLEHKDMEFYYADADERGYIKQLNFKVNEVPVEWDYDPEHKDIAILQLNNSLQQGESIKISTPFEVKIPGSFSRLGHAGQSYQITQWYPKPAVYDQKGWHPMPYLDIGEFYSEFGSFDVFITVPKNYRVAATGNLQNEEELRWLDSLVALTKEKYIPEAEEMEPDDAIIIQGAKPMNINYFPPSSNETKTLHFQQEKVHDFAWFADKRYNVLKGEVTLPHSGRTVNTWSFFTDYEGNVWKNSIHYVNKGIFFYSEHIGDYPYQNATAVEGGLKAGGGMEYPTITVIAETGNSVLLETVIVHEIGHNWVYGVLANNEREYPWMDEGINTYYEYRYFREKYDTSSILPAEVNNALNKILGIDDFNERKLTYLSYLHLANQNLDQPIQAPSEEYTMTNYGTITYFKAGMAMGYLSHYLGQEEFDHIMQEYYEQWKFKHPQPEDFRKIVESESQKNLDWFFDDLLLTTKDVDYKINRVWQDLEGVYYIELVNKGEISGPVPVSAMKDNEIISEIWVEGFEGDTVVSLPLMHDPDLFRIDPNEISLDEDRGNNTWYMGKTFPKVEPWRVRALGSLNRPYRKQLYFMPVIGWNNYDKFMLGAAFYNDVFPAQNFDFTIVPMLNFTNWRPVGMAEANYQWYPNNGMVHEWDFGLCAKTFHYDVVFPGHQGIAVNEDAMLLQFMKLQPSIKMKFKKETFNSPRQHSIKYRLVYVEEDQRQFVNSDNGHFQNALNSYYVNVLSYNFINSRALNPWNFEFQLRQNNEMARTSIELNYEISWKYNKRGIDLRLYAGTFLYRNEHLSGGFSAPYAFSLSGLSGTQDFMYDYVYLGRSEHDGFLNQQMNIAEGGLKVRTDKFPFGTSDKWIAALNVEVPILKLPFNIYGDLTTFGGAGDLPNTDPVLWNAGVAFTPIPNIFEIYFPVISSPDLKEAAVAGTDNYLERITFMVRFDRLNPLEFLRTLHF